MATLYLVAAIVGAIAPFVFFADFISQNGFGFVTFVQALFTNGASGGFTVDLLISSAVFWVFLWRDAPRAHVAHPWIYVAVNLAIGLSCALPLYLYVRTRSDGAG